MMEDTLNKCRDLRLKAFTENLERVIEESAKKNWPCLRTIEHLLDLELEKRKLARIDACFKASRLTETRTRPESSGCLTWSSSRIKRTSSS
jgi:hypothetical protein